ncbi:unnamed protein product [Moneuplotes crassus]|uniref:Macro domain-containing protein n=1 Tax=Euplotes crassus TaxID=5936 RepID=A0AAD1ULZ8_EUPCR|nr:unnamed protein product [Moneuplotes crassus]
MFSFFKKKEKSEKKEDFEQEYKGIKIIHRIADITKETTDCIVNAANGSLAHGGGVAYAISKAGGKELNQDSRKWIKDHGTIETGETAYTSKGNLACNNYCIHTVGPIWRGGKENEDKLLRDAVRNAFIRASELEQNSISIPAISSGIFGYPLKRACIQIARGTKEYIDNQEEYKNTLSEIVMCNLIPKTSYELQEQCVKILVEEEEEKKKATEDPKEPEEGKIQEQDGEEDPEKEDSHEKEVTEEGEVTDKMSNMRLSEDQEEQDGP